MICTHPSAKASWETFLNVIHFAVDQFVPKYTTLQKSVIVNASGILVIYVNWPLKSKNCGKNTMKNRHDQVINIPYRECVNNWRQQLNSHEKQIESQVIDSNYLGGFLPRDAL